MGILGALGSELGVLIGFAIVILIIWKLGGFILKLIFGIITNTILGFITLFLANYFFGLGITFSTGVMIVTALFGLPGVGTMIVLKFFGIAI
ncbi:MAG: pro-sigmaK processing inhibitor BofA family protein [Candidatus Micrarchaeales archaeon]|jgi:hypothetical protein